MANFFSQIFASAPGDGTATQPASGYLAPKGQGNGRIRQVFSRVVIPDLSDVDGSGTDIDAGDTIMLLPLSTGDRLGELWIGWDNTATGTLTLDVGLYDLTSTGGLGGVIAADLFLDGANGINAHAWADDFETAGDLDVNNRFARLWDWGITAGTGMAANVQKDVCIVCTVATEGTPSASLTLNVGALFRDD
tara:strand:- start:17175 stop:17750 length:576 start_codon:yes stop_codon:yes gene_type:complete